jgi:hypothetical protein
MGGGGCRNLQTARKPGKPAEITGAEQGRNRKSRLRTSQSPLPAKDDVRIVLVGASLCDHPAKALAHLLQDEVCARRRARHAKKPSAVSARACCTIFSGYAFLHESRNKVKQNFSVADSQGILAPARIPGPRAGLSASAGIAFMRLACVPVMLDQEVPPAPTPPCGVLVGEGWGRGSRNLRCRRSISPPPTPSPSPHGFPQGRGARRLRGTFVRQQHRNTL